MYTGTELGGCGDTDFAEGIFQFTGVDKINHMSQGCQIDDFMDN